MTDAQRTNFYFPKWWTVSKAFDWVMAGGRLVADLDAQYETAATFSTLARDLVRDIIARARELAGREARATTAEDLRHGCNLVASGGKHASATKLTNAHLNEFARICAVLAKPFEDNLAAAIPFLNPDEDDRRRLIEYLRTLTYEARIIAISKNKWHTGDWEALRADQLRTLIVIVKGGRRQPVGQPF